jgi:hypothetical protein
VTASLSLVRWSSARGCSTRARSSRTTKATVRLAVFPFHCRCACARQRSCNLHCVTPRDAVVCREGEHTNDVCFVVRGAFSAHCNVNIPGGALHASTDPLKSESHGMYHQAPRRLHRPRPILLSVDDLARMFPRHSAADVQLQRLHAARRASLHGSSDSPGLDAHAVVDSDVDGGASIGLKSARLDAGDAVKAVAVSATRVLPGGVFGHDSPSVATVVADVHDAAVYRVLRPALHAVVAAAAASLGRGKDSHEASTQLRLQRFVSEPLPGPRAAAADDSASGGGGDGHSVHSRSHDAASESLAWFTGSSFNQDYPVVLSRTARGPRTRVSYMVPSASVRPARRPVGTDV